MNNSQYEFPDYFPEGCPPDDAIQEEIDVYRICKNKDKVTSDDFISYYNINPVRFKDNIQAYGLSVIQKEEDCKNLMKLPNMKKKFKAIAKGKTYKSMGVVKKTPNRSCKSHCTWWLYKDAKPEELFEIV